MARFYWPRWPHAPGSDSRGGLRALLVVSSRLTSQPSGSQSSTKTDRRHQPHPFLSARGDRELHPVAARFRLHGYARSNPTVNQKVGYFLFYLLPSGKLPTIVHSSAMKKRPAPIWLTAGTKKPSPICRKR